MIRYALHAHTFLFDNQVRGFFLPFVHCRLRHPLLLLDDVIVGVHLEYDVSAFAVPVVHDVVQLNLPLLAALAIPVLPLPPLGLELVLPLVTRPTY